MADLRRRRHTTNNGGRDWSALPSDALAAIANSSLPLLDYLRLRSVCKSWAHAVPPLAMPLLILPTNAADSLTFCSLASPQTTFDSPAPPGVAGAHIVGSHDGWLAMCDRALNVFLFNPFTVDRIDLPPFTTDDGDFGSARHRRRYIKKIVFSSSPTPQNLMAVAIGVGGGIVYTRAGEDKWNSFTPHCTDDDDCDFGEDAEFFCAHTCGNVHDVLFHDGRFWAIHGYRKLLAFDLSGEGLPEVSLVFDIFRFHRLIDCCQDVGLGGDDRVLYDGRLYLAVGSAGNVVVVIRDTGEDVEWFQGRSLVVMEFVGPVLNRVRGVRSLEGHSLFVGYNNGFSLPVEDGQLRGDCVFITDVIYDIRHEKYEMGVFDMGNGRL